MKSGYCKHYDHSRCVTSECDCRCHAVREDVPEVAVILPITGSPPPHPEPFDHTKFRVAEELPGTDRTVPWRLDYCRECKYPVWTHSAADDHMCEECYFSLLQKLTDDRVQQENRAARSSRDPFAHE